MLALDYYLRLLLVPEYILFSGTIEAMVMLEGLYQKVL